MANDSSTGGYLAPLAPDPPADDVLEGVLRDLVAGVTGLPRDRVLPQWPATASAPPEPSQNWCATGITSLTSDAGPLARHDGAAEGSDTYARHQDLALLCSFYGPAAMAYAQRLVDGVAIAQNREQLSLRDMAIVGVERIEAVPPTVDVSTPLHYDLTLRLRRKIIRTYPVRNLLFAQVGSTTDSTPPVVGAIVIDL